MLPEDTSEREVCSVISQAALMGARGNSGVILSQIVRGAMEVLGQDGPVTQDVLTRALRHATETAYRAVRKPVEGTMLTVLREMAEAAAQAPDAQGLRSVPRRGHRGGLEERGEDALAAARAGRRRRGRCRGVRPRGARGRSRQRAGRRRDSSHRHAFRPNRGPSRRRSNGPWRKRATSRTAPAFC